MPEGKPLHFLVIDKNIMRINIEKGIYMMSTNKQYLLRH
jgi:hypothetical protein